MRVRMIMALMTVGYLWSGATPAFSKAKGADDTVLPSSGGRTFAGDPDLRGVWVRALGILEPEVRTVAVGVSGSVFVGTRRAVYRLGRGEQRFRSVFTVPGGETSVNLLYIDPREDHPGVFAATDNGLFYSPDGEKGWERIFAGAGVNGRRCSAVTVVGEDVFVATGDGVFEGRRGGRVWRRAPGKLGREPVFALAAYGNTIYAAGRDTLFRWDPETSTIVRTFSVTGREEGADDEAGGVSEISPADGMIRAIRISRDGTVWLATADGVYRGSVAGGAWRLLGPSGAAQDGVLTLEVREDQTGDRVLVGTGGGLFRWDADGWRFVRGMEYARVLGIGCDGEGLWAATDHGLFRGVNGAREPSGAVGSDGFDVAWWRRILDAEPSVREVQRLAVSYAEVYPEKILRWRRQARWRAFVPSVSVGFNRAATDLYHWDTGRSPDELLKGRDYLDWDVSVSWDLGDFVWSTDQTAIDSRSKLMVELREDILDQVTRLYFERRRAQMAWLVSAPLSPRERWERRLRLDELTAQIDAYTGGAFSRRIGRSVGPDSPRTKPSPRQTVTSGSDS